MPVGGKREGFKINEEGRNPLVGPYWVGEAGAACVIICSIKREELEERICSNAKNNFSRVSESETETMSSAYFCAGTDL